MTIIANPRCENMVERRCKLFSRNDCGFACGPAVYRVEIVFPRDNDVYFALVKVIESSAKLWILSSNNSSGKGS